MTNRKRTKGQTTIYKTLHRKLKMEEHEPHQNPDVRVIVFLLAIIYVNITQINYSQFIISTIDLQYT
jgi:hypothetical protein